MKKLSIFVLGLCVLFSFTPKPRFHLTGSISGGIEGMKVYLQYADVQGQKALDSAVLRKGKFVFSGNMPSPRYCTILFKDTSTKKDRYLEDKVIELFVENSDISVAAPYDSLHIQYDKYVSGVQTDALVVNGSESNALYLQYYKPASRLRKENTDLFTQYIKFLNPDSGQVRQPRATGMALAAKMDVLDSLRKVRLMGFIQDHPVGPVTAFLASNALNYGNMTVTDVDGLLTHFEGGKGNDFLVSKFLKDAEEMKKTVVGSSLIDVTLKDTAGASHALSDYVGKGKYVLVECWASWCNPCRADIPHLKEVYDLYHPYGFEIVSVSLDDKRDNWTRAIGQEKMPWLQLSDMEAFSGPLPKSYHINGIPHCLLFDPQGKLVTVNMRGSWMDTRLIRMYGNHFPEEGMAHSEMQEDSNAYQASIKDLNDREVAMYPMWGKGSGEEQAKLESEVEAIEKQKEARADVFIKDHPSSAFSVSLISGRAVMGDYEKVSKGYALLSTEGQHTAEGQRIAQRLEVLKRSAPGQTAIDFTESDTTGKPVRFETFKGKYVLLDFWASWCGPCRAENPNVLKAFNKYKNRNFTVVGVSLDQDDKSWKNAIRDDKMPWAQLSDIKSGKRNEVATYYGIMGIPSNLLIDPSGKIVARNLRGEALHARLAEILE